MAAEATVEVLYSTGVVGIVRASSWEEAQAKASAMITAGLTVVEVSLSTPNAVQAICAVAADHPGAIVGAGTVCDPAAALAVIEAGARIIVTPFLQPAVI